MKETIESYRPTYRFPSSYESEVIVPEKITWKQIVQGAAVMLAIVALIYVCLIFT